MARRDTRGLILEVSLDLFNRQGEPNVTTNLIALEADISPGNLYYHFRSKDDIALDLFKRFLGELQPLLHADPDEFSGVEELWLRLHLIYETMGRYRFVYRNLGDLMVRLPDLGKALGGLLQRKAQMLHSVLQQLSSARAKQLGQAQRHALVENLLLAMTYWIPYAELRNQAAPDDGSVLSDAVSRTLMQIAPYLEDQAGRDLVELAESYLA